MIFCLVSNYQIKYPHLCGERPLISASDWMPLSPSFAICRRSQCPRAQPSLMIWSRSSSPKFLTGSSCLTFGTALWGVCRAGVGSGFTFYTIWQTVAHTCTFYSIWQILAQHFTSALVGCPLRAQRSRLPLT